MLQFIFVLKTRKLKKVLKKPLEKNFKFTFSSECRNNIEGATIMLFYCHPPWIENITLLRDRRDYHLLQFLPLRWRSARSKAIHGLECFIYFTDSLNVIIISMSRIRNFSSSSCRLGEGWAVSLPSLCLFPISHKLFHCLQDKHLTWVL